MAELDKNTHLGRAGEFFAMSELLLRGWNVAVPVVDVGDDVFVIDDRDKTTFRVQAKSTVVQPSTAVGPITARFTLKRSQLRDQGPVVLFFFFLIRTGSSWRYLVIPRERLSDMRDTFESAERAGPGRPPATDHTAKSDGLALDVMIDGDAAYGWKQNLTEFLERWPEELEVIEGAPGPTAGA